MAEGGNGEGFTSLRGGEYSSLYGVIIYLVSHCIEFDRPEVFEPFVSNLSIKFKLPPTNAVKVFHPHVIP